MISAICQVRLLCYVNISNPDVDMLSTDRYDVVELDIF